MEDDIVERLRLAFDPSLVSSPFGSHDDWEICLVHEAADEIERLRKRVRDLEFDKYEPNPYD